jgi:hypothetical protein
MGSAMNRLTASADAASADWAKRLDVLVERAQPEQWNATAEKALSGASAVGAELQRQSTVWCAEVERLHEATQRVVDFSEQQLAEQRGQRANGPTPAAEPGPARASVPASAASSDLVAELAAAARELRDPDDVRALILLAQRLRAR